jgi:alanine racemase
MYSRNTFVEINVPNYIDNLDYFRENLKYKIMPVVKANAYGHGSVELASAAEKNGYDYFAVAFIEEAMELRKNKIHSPILVFNYFRPEFLKVALQNNLTVTLYAYEQLESMNDNCNGVKAHINIDTGMNRVGIKPEQFGDFFERAVKCGFEVEGAYTHYAVADSLDKGDMEFTRRQERLFMNAIKGYPLKYVHISNSAGAIREMCGSSNYIRIGVSSYGMKPSETVFPGVIKPVLTFKSIISMVKQVPAGEPVSYGRTYVSKKEITVATIPVGYADGYPRKLSNKGNVLVHGKKCRIIGRICMDQMMVDVTGIRNVRIGDEVVLIGEQGSEVISAEEVAQLCDTINYEITSGISERVPRHYIN